MPRKRFSDEQIAFALRQAGSGTSIGEVCRKVGVADATFYLYGRLFRCKQILTCPA
jgi:putative transposase